MNNNGTFFRRKKEAYPGFLTLLAPLLDPHRNPRHFSNSWVPICCITNIKLLAVVVPTTTTPFATPCIYATFVHQKITLPHEDAAIKFEEDATFIAAAATVALAAAYKAHSHQKHMTPTTNSSINTFWDSHY